MTLTPDELTTLITDLRATAHEIRTRGWTTENYWSQRTGRVCALGGAATAVHRRLPVRTSYYDPRVDRFSFSVLSPTEHERFRRVEKAADDYVKRHQLIPGVDPNDPNELRMFPGIVDWNDQVCESGEEAAELFEAVAAELEQQAADALVTQLLQAGDQS